MIAVGNQIGGWTVAAARALDGDAELIRLVRGGTSLGFVIAPDGATICRLDVDVAGGGTLLGSGIRARATAVLAGAVSERAASFRHYGTQTGASTVPLRDAPRRRT